MGWLRKLFGSQQDEKRRTERIDLGSARDIALHLLQADSKSQGSTLVSHVKNVSMRGCRVEFENSSDVRRLRPQASGVASLIVEGFAIPLTVEIIRVIGNKSAALQFKEPYPKELQRLDAYLQPRCLGNTLRRISSERTRQQNKEFELVWFQGANDTNLFSWVDKQSGQIQHQQLVFLNKVIEWEHPRSLQTGRIMDDSQSDGVYGLVQSELIEFDAVKDPKTIEFAKILIQSSQIDVYHRDIFLEKCG